MPPRWRHWSRLSQRGAPRLFQLLPKGDEPAALLRGRGVVVAAIAAADVLRAGGPGAAHRQHWRVLGVGGGGEEGEAAGLLFEAGLIGCGVVVRQHELLLLLLQAAAGRGHANRLLLLEGLGPAHAAELALLQAALALQQLRGRLHAVAGPGGLRGGEGGAAVRGTCEEASGGAGAASGRADHQSPLAAQPRHAGTPAPHCAAAGCSVLRGRRSENNTFCIPSWHFARTITPLVLLLVGEHWYEVVGRQVWSGTTAWGFEGSAGCSAGLHALAGGAGSCCCAASSFTAQLNERLDFFFGPVAAVRIPQTCGSVSSRHASE